ncbi:MAG: glycosyltransferase family 8 protein [Tepidisphaeraceae bacterium]
MTNTPVVIACAADQRYALPLTVMLRSVLANLSPGRKLVVHVVDGGIACQDKQRVAASMSAERCTIRWVSPERSRFVGLPLWGRMPIATYDKLLVCELLPHGTSKVLWLDCDLLALADVGKLWDLPLDSHHVLAVQDAIVPNVSSRWGVAGHQEIGLDPNAKYFNAGVVLVDLNLWRRDDVAGKALTYLRQYRDDVYFWDQEGLNAALSGRWGELDPRWNWNASLGTLKRDGEGAWIAHFSGALKPWRYRGQSGHHARFYEYLDQTEWAGWRPPLDWRAAAISRYEASRLRRVIYPLERWWMRLQRKLTQRHASEEDVCLPTKGR